MEENKEQVALRVLKEIIERIKKFTFFSKLGIAIIVITILLVPVVDLYIAKGNLQKEFQIIVDQYFQWGQKVIPWFIGLAIVIEFFGKGGKKNE